MNKTGKFLMELLVLVIISSLVNTSWTQEKKTKETFKQENKITTPQNIIDSISVPKGDIKREDIERESHKNLERNVDINFLTLVVTIIGVLIAFLTLLVMIAVALGFFEISKRKYKKADAFTKWLKTEKENIRSQISI